MLAKSLSGEELARELLFILQAQYNITSTSLVATMHDRASVNDLALSIIKVMYPQVLDVGCFSHTLNNAGSKINTPLLNEFTTSWISLFSHSAKARLAWSAHTGIAVKSYCETRWWSKWEVAKQVMELFEDVVSFLEEFGVATRKKMLGILCDKEKRSILELELAAIIDGGLPFVQATYQLEGDDALIFTCFDELNAVYHAIEVANLPNVNRIAQRLACGNQVVENKLIEYAMSCIKPAHDYFLLKFHNDLHLALSAFKAAQLFCPAKVKCCKPVAQEVDAVKAFPFLCDNECIRGLKEELPKYLALADSTAPDDSAEILPWWKQYWSSFSRYPCSTFFGCSRESIFSTEKFIH